MQTVTDLAQREERMPFVRFERVPVEDKEATRKAGYYVARDEDYALVTPPYSKDVFKQKAKVYLAQLDVDVQNERVPKEWVAKVRESYKLWQNGQETPIEGYPIKDWGLLSPAQRETLLRMNILTVEDLAGINDEGVRRIGMGALEMKQKAKAWLVSLRDKGAVTQEVARLQTENKALKETIAQQQEAIERLDAQVKGLSAPPSVTVTTMMPMTQATAIEAADVVPDEFEGMTREQLRDAWRAQLGKTPPPNMSDEKLREGLRR